MNEIKEFLNYLLIDLKYSSNTIETYRYTLVEFNKIVKKDLKQVIDEDIRKYIQILQKDDAKTINHHLNVLTSFYNFLLIENKINKNPIQNIDKLKIRKKLPKVLTKEEVVQILDIDLVNQYSYRDKAMLELMYSSGLRISELVSLKMYNLDLDMGILRVMGKGNKERMVPIGEAAIYYLTLYIYEYRNLLNKHGSDYLFLNNRGTDISRQAFFKMLQKQVIKKISKLNLHHIP